MHFSFSNDKNITISSYNRWIWRGQWTGITKQKKFYAATSLQQIRSWQYLLFIWYHTGWKIISTSTKGDIISFPVQPSNYVQSIDTRPRKRGEFGRKNTCPNHSLLIYSDKLRVWAGSSSLYVICPPPSATWAFKCVPACEWHVDDGTAYRYSYQWTTSQTGISHCILTWQKLKHSS